jgi:tRNA U55 pseudouridine synthase TruB
MGELLAKTRDAERVSQREQEGQMKAMQELKMRVEHASRALEKMAGENTGLRKQVQTLERQRGEAEAEQQRKLIDSLQEFRQREAKLKAKCKKYQKLKNDTLEGLKSAQNYQVQQDTYFRKLINDLE